MLATYTSIVTRSFPRLLPLVLESYCVGVRPAPRWAERESMALRFRTVCLSTDDALCQSVTFAKINFKKITVLVQLFCTCT